MNAAERDRLKRVIQYVIQECVDQARFGLTKLNKIVWSADLEHRRRYGRSITGVSYRRKDNGPMIDGVYALIAELEADGMIASTTQRVFDHDERRLVSIARQPVDLSDFDGNEIAVLGRAILEYDGLTAKQSSERSHRFLGWMITDENEIIPDAYAELTWELPTAADVELAMSKPALTRDDFAKWRAETGT